MGWFVFGYAMFLYGGVAIGAAAIAPGPTAVLATLMFPTVALFYGGCVLFSIAVDFGDDVHEALRDGAVGQVVPFWIGAAAGATPVLTVATMLWTRALGTGSILLGVFASVIVIFFFPAVAAEFLAYAVRRAMRRPGPSCGFPVHPAAPARRRRVDV